MPSSWFTKLLTQVNQFQVNEARPCNGDGARSWPRKTIPLTEAYNCEIILLFIRYTSYTPVPSKQQTFLEAFEGLDL